MQQQTKRSFHVGDKVTFPVVKHGARTTRITVKEATIVQVFQSTATVKYRNGQKVQVALEDLTPAGERNALTKALLGD